jgi:hypothetical protein
MSVSIEIQYESQSLNLNSVDSHILTTEYRTREEKGRFVDTLTLLIIGSESEKIEAIEALGYYSEMSQLQNEIDLSKLYLIREISSNSRRAEIYKMLLIHKPETFDLLLRSSPEITLEITRGMWEKEESANLFLLRPDEETSTDQWVVLQNVSDGSRYNYLFVDPDYLDHSYPAPIEFRIRNDTSSTSSTVLVACNDEEVGLYHVLECESGTGGSTQPAMPDTDAYSNGFYQEVEITSEKTNVLSWTLTGSDLQSLKGSSFVLLLRPAVSISSGIHLQITLETGGVTVAETTEIISEGSEEVFEMGSLYIPNLNRYALTNVPDDYTLRLYAWGDETTLSLDYLELIPYKYGYRRILISGENFSQNQILVLSEVEDIAYLENSEKVSNPLVVFGNPILVPSHCTPVLYFKILGTAEHVLQEFSVKATYRGRYVL